VVEAILVWRQFPTQIESDLQIYCKRKIVEWHRRSLSSRELLVLLAGLPDVSKYKEASERTYRVVEYTGEGELKGKLILTPAIGPQLPETELVEEFVDWTFDQKLMARTVRELCVANGYTDFSGVTEPLTLVQQKHAANKAAKLQAKAENFIHAGLYGMEKAVSRDVL
jgi:hypothetical protein